MTEAPLDVFCRLFKPHPWHGVPLGDEAPERLVATLREIEEGERR